jgi:hypothetical protein
MVLGLEVADVLLEVEVVGSFASFEKPNDDIVIA